MATIKTATTAITAITTITAMIVVEVDEEDPVDSFEPRRQTQTTEFKHECYLRKNETSPKTP